jgi:hypothetical protein
MEKIREEKHRSGFESWTKNLEKALGWLSQPESWLTEEDYKQRDRAALDKMKMNKMRATYFDVAIRYCNLIIDELFNQQTIPEEDAKALKASLSLIRESFYHNKSLNLASEQILLHKELDATANKILKICKSLESEQQKAA